MSKPSVFTEVFDIRLQTRAASWLTGVGPYLMTPEAGDHRTLTLRLGRHVEPHL